MVFCGQGLLRKTLQTMRRYVASNDVDDNDNDADDEDGEAEKFEKPHKLILRVRTDLKIQKGEISLHLGTFHYVLINRLVVRNQSLCVFGNLGHNQKTVVQISSREQALSCC